MDKLKIVVVPEKNIVASMSGCGRNWDNLCGSKRLRRRKKSRLTNTNYNYKSKKRLKQSLTTMSNNLFLLFYFQKSDIPLSPHQTQNFMRSLIF